MSFVVVVLADIVSSLIISLPSTCIFVRYHIICMPFLLLINALYDCYCSWR